MPCLPESSNIRPAARLYPLKMHHKRADFRGGSIEAKGSRFGGCFRGMSSLVAERGLTVIEKFSLHNGIAAAVF